MTCPFCGHIHDKVVDSRESKEGDLIRRRWQCLGCDRRFTTYERIDEVPYMVIKKDGRREKFDRQKVLGGLLKACEKRPISMVRLSELVNRQRDLLCCGGAGDILEAQRMVAAQKPDLALLDLRLGHADGLELIKVLKI